MERLTDPAWMPMMRFGFVTMVLFWVLLIAGLILLAKWLVDQGRMSREDSALDILKKRYARGEITRQEFEEMKRDILT